MAALPDGVSAADWALERVRTQNPCIRTILRCLHLLERVDTFTYYILHCSPSQLAQVRQQVVRVVTLFDQEGIPRLRESSCIPELGRARAAVLESWEGLTAEGLARIEGGEGGGASTSPAARRALSHTIGRLEGLLEDAFGRLMAADPRSRRDADYFLSQQFARHVTETETLYGQVYDLQAFLEAQGTVGTRAVNALAALLIRGAAPSVRAAWAPVVQFLRLVREELLPRLGALVVMQGIRFNEARVLDELGVGLRVLVEVIGEQQRNLTEIEARSAREGAVSEGGSRLIVSQRLAKSLLDFETKYRTLREFMPSWLHNLEARRALMLLPPSARPKREGSSAGGDADA